MLGMKKAHFPLKKATFSYNCESWGALAPSVPTFLRHWAHFVVE